MSENCEILLKSITKHPCEICLSGIKLIKTSWIISVFKVRKRKKTSLEAKTSQSKHVVAGRSRWYRCTSTVLDIAHCLFLFGFYIYIYIVFVFYLNTIYIYSSLFLFYLYIYMCIYRLCLFCWKSPKFSFGSKIEFCTPSVSY